MSGMQNGGTSASYQVADLHRRGDWRHREASENFPVALSVLPRTYREDLHAVYAFARTVDELGDSAAGDRTAQLHRIDSHLLRLWNGEHVDDDVLTRVHRTATRRGISVAPFRNLVRANLQDQVVSRYATFDDLLAYCRLSADPVGRIVLAIFGANDAATVALSDQVCTALQLLEHWQDVGEDRRAGRIYLPQEDRERYAVQEGDLDAPRATPALRELMRFEIERAASMLEDGALITRRLHGWARPSVAGFVAGGLATVTALRRTGGDVLARDAAPSSAETAARFAGLLVAAVLPCRAGR